MKKTVIYEIHLNDLNKLKQFKKVVVEEFEDVGDAYIALTHWRENNFRKDIRYVIGHPN